MLKRVEKRRRKKQEEEELGLDEEMKEVLGMQDTDSDESESDSDSGSEQEDKKERVSSGRKRKLDECADDVVAVENEDEDSDNQDDEPPITVQEALRDPLYTASLDSDVKSCIICPRKLLKNAKMIKLHNSSNGHNRRLKRFTALASNVDPDTNAWDLIQQIQQSFLNPLVCGGPTREEKRKAKLAAVKAKRHRWKSAKAKAKASKMKSNEVIPEDSLGSTEDKVPTAEPKGKKRKVDPAPLASTPPKKAPKAAPLSNSPSSPKMSKSKPTDKKLKMQSGESKNGLPRTKKPRYFSEDQAELSKKAKRRKGKEDTLQVFD